MDSIISPLNNWSEEFIKFKISAYPNRYFLGDIDSTKIDLLHLDYYNLYSLNTSSDSINQALNYTERLLTKRFNYFCKKDITEFFDEKVDIKEFYKEIFYITANVPRSIGRLLWYVDRFTISKGNKISIKYLHIASEQFYKEAIEEFFSKTMHVKFSYDEKLNKYHLENILKSIVNKAKQNKTEIGKSDAIIFMEYNTNTAPTSFFYLEKDPAYENILSSLELNYFITKYNEQKDKDGRFINVYWLNHGLCQKENIIFGKGSDRKYIIERRFNYGALIKDYIDSAQEIKCQTCGKVFDIVELEMLKKYSMKCYECQGNCVIADLNVNLPEPSMTTLPEIEYDLLYTLAVNKKPLFASQIAAELDCSYQLISKRAMKLKELGYLKKKKEILDEYKSFGQRSYYYLTEKAYSEFDFIYDESSLVVV